MSFTASLDELIKQSTNGLLASHPSWCRAKLFEVAKILNGFPFSSENFSNDSGMPLLRIRDILNGRTETTFEGTYDPVYIVEPGELVVGMDGDFNAALWKGPRALLNQRVCKISPDPQFYCKKFLFYLLPGYLRTINEHTSSITVKHLSSRTVGEIPLPLPSLAEQARIVAEIEKQFTRLDVAMSSLQHAKSSLKRYRASILESACYGRLVPTEAELARTEGREYESADKLLERIAQGQAREEAGGVFGEKLPSPPEGWCWTEASRVSEFITKGTTPAESALLQGTGEIPYIRVHHLSFDGALHFEDRPIFVSRDAHEALRRSVVKPGDVLMNIVGPPLGKVAIVPDLYDEWNMNQAIARYRPLAGINNKFFSRILQASNILAWATRRAKTTSGQVNLTLEICRELPLLIAPEPEQERIANEIERRFSLLDKFDAIIETSLRRAQTLRLSILRNAFSGKLVPQDPTDEPAVILLESIRKNREATADSRPRRGRGIKPGVSTPGPMPSNDPKPRRGGGSDPESASAPPGLLGDLGDDFLGLKPQALRPGPVGAETSDGDASALLHLSGDQQTRVIWEHLVGMGPLHRDDAIRTVARFLRYRGLIASDYLRNGSVLWHAIANAIDFGVKKGLFDRPRRGEVRALLPDARDYSLELWSLCLLVSMNFGTIDEDQALRAAAEEARRRMGLKFERLRSNGVILQGLREALEDEVRQGHLRRQGGKVWLTPVEELEKLMDSEREP